MREFWKDVPGYELFYKASKSGKIWSKRENRLLSGYIDNGGYVSILLCNGETRWRQRRSRVVYRTFGQEINEFDLIHHKDENKLNDRYSNLEKTNRSAHKILHINIGLKTRFKKVHYITKESVLKLMEQGKFISEIATIKGCSERTVSRLLKK